MSFLDLLFGNALGGGGAGQSPQSDEQPGKMSMNLRVLAAEADLGDLAENVVFFQIFSDEGSYPSVACEIPNTILTQENSGSFLNDLKELVANSLALPREHVCNLFFRIAKPASGMREVTIAIQTYKDLARVLRHRFYDRVIYVAATPQASPTERTVILVPLHPPRAEDRDIPDRYVTRIDFKDIRTREDLFTAITTKLMACLPKTEKDTAASATGVSAGSSAGGATTDAVASTSCGVSSMDIKVKYIRHYTESAFSQTTSIDTLCSAALYEVTDEVVANLLHEESSPIAFAFALQKSGKSRGTGKKAASQMYG